MLVWDDKQDPLKNKESIKTNLIFMRASGRRKGEGSLRRDLNPRPTDYKSVALPAELRRRELARSWIS